MPKKVATKVAQSGAGFSGAPGPSATSEEDSSPPSSSWGHLADRLFGVVNRERNYVRTAGPLAEIDQAAALAAKGKSASAAFAGFLQMGQRSLMERLRQASSDGRGQRPDCRGENISASGDFTFCKFTSDFWP